MVIKIIGIINANLVRKSSGQTAHWLSETNEKLKRYNLPLETTITTTANIFLSNAAELINCSRTKFVAIIVNMLVFLC